MSKMLAASVAIAAIAGPVHATQYTCRPEIGGHLPPPAAVQDASYKIVLDHVGKSWRITHFLSNGQIEDITDQYEVVDGSRPGGMALPDGAEMWMGKLRANASLSISGVMLPFNGELTYTESRNANFTAVYDCAVTSQPTVAVVAPAPAPVLDSALIVDSVPIVASGTNALVDVRLGPT
jgi:hypothetical protein